MRSTLVLPLVLAVACGQPGTGGSGGGTASSTGGGSSSTAGGDAAGGAAGGDSTGGGSTAGGATAGGATAGGATAGGATAGGGTSGGSTAGGGTAGGSTAGGSAAGGTARDGGTTGLIPLTDWDGGAATRYLGQFDLWLYPNGNAVPPVHRDAGLQAARLVQPLDADGGASDAGKIVLMSIGFSNATQEWCTDNVQADGGPPCYAWTFTGQALADPQVDKSHLVIVDGARGSQTSVLWANPADSNWNRVRDERLAPLGLTEKQVQVLWIKFANGQPMTPLPAANSDTYVLQAQVGAIVRNAKARYPSLKQVFLASRIYAGWANTPLNPEPYAYEGGLAVKWAIEAQIRQANTGMVDARSGNLDYGSVAAWMAWGPYLWADGLSPRSDGLVWPRTDFAADGTHPSMSGQQKVGGLLLNFFKQSPFTRCWFLSTGATCP